MKNPGFLWLGLLMAEALAFAADGNSALLTASYEDDLPRVEQLLAAGAGVNAANDLGATPLWVACQNGSEAMVKRLLEAGADSNAALLLGETPLMMAARVGNPEIVRLLLVKRANPNARAARGQTALMWAVAQRHAPVVKLLLDHGADVQARTDQWTDTMAVEPHGYLPYNRAIPHGGGTALLFAVRVGDLVSAKLLVEAGGRVNDADAWGVSAAVLAAHAGFPAMLAFLLEKGADPNAAGAGFAAIHAAILRRDEEMVRMLLAKGADPDLELKTWTPTRRSSRDLYFHPTLVGATPFWLAARFLQPAVMRLLAAHGADPRCVHRSHHVSDGKFEPRIEVTNALLAALGLGSRGNAWVEPPRDQRAALTLEAVKLAVELGADLNATNTDGRRALEAARALPYPEVVRFLQEKGAR